MSAPEQQPERLLYTYREGERLLDCSRWTLYRLEEAGLLETVPWGARQKRITGKSLHKLAQTGVKHIRDTSRDAAQEGRAHAAA